MGSRLKRGEFPERTKTATRLSKITIRKLEKHPTPNTGKFFIRTAIRILKNSHVSFPLFQTRAGNERLAANFWRGEGLDLISREA